MPYAPPANLPRRGVVDLGSNSVRLVVYEGNNRNPVPIFNEKAVLRLGRGLQATGRLNDEGIGPALMVMQRYYLIGKAMGASPFEVLATAAVRDATNGPDFVASLQTRMPGVPIRILSGPEEAEYSADGMLCGIPDADGILADIGGGSLEVVRLTQGTRGASQTLRLGVIRLADRSRGDLNLAREIVEADIATVPWLTEGSERDLYLVGGAWRALARIQMARSNYPLQMVHHYGMDAPGTRDLTNMIAAASRRTLERMPGAPKRRLDDLPYAAIALRRLLRVTGAKRVVFSASGLREGWFMRHMPDDIRSQDPLLAACQEMAQRLGRDPALPEALFCWTGPLFPVETPDHRRLRLAACWVSDIGSHDHPEFRAEQAFLRVLRQPGVGLDHETRAFLGLAVALRYEAYADAPFLRSARALLDIDSVSRAEKLGTALRLAYTLSAGTPDLLSGTSLRIQGSRLILGLQENLGVFAGESVTRRLERLAETAGLQAERNVSTTLIHRVRQFKLA
ncbi:MAG: Ppx/GppA family phosphatase, partial [Rhodospirillales bacterium]